MILSTIQAVVAALPKKCAFTYGNLYEANGELDIPALSEGKEIFFVYIAPLENTDKPQDDGILHTTFPLQFFMLKKLTDDKSGSVEYRSEEVEPIVNEMRELARNFLHSLESQDIVEKGTEFANGIGDRKFTSEYGWADNHLFGVSVQCDVPIMEGKTGCYLPEG